MEEIEQYIIEHTEKCRNQIQLFFQDLLEDTPCNSRSDTHPDDACNYDSNNLYSCLQSSPIPPQSVEISPNPTPNNQEQISEIYSDLSNTWRCKLCNTFNIKEFEICNKLDERTEEKEQNLSLSISPISIISRQILDTSQLDEDPIDLDEWEYVNVYQRA